MNIVPSVEGDDTSEDNEIHKEENKQEEIKSLIIPLNSSWVVDELEESEFESVSESYGMLNLKAKISNFTL